MITITFVSEWNKIRELNHFDILRKSDTFQPFFIRQALLSWDFDLLPSNKFQIYTSFDAVASNFYHFSANIEWTPNSIRNSNDFDRALINPVIGTWPQIL